MIKKSLKNSIIAGALCTVLTVPLFAQAASIQPIPADAIKAAPISYKLKHWSETYIDQLSKNHDVDFVFKGKNLNAPIKLEDFQSLVKLIIDEEYVGTPDSLAREAVVYELAKIWAEKTGKDLDNIAVIKMIIYSDTGKIDAKYNHGVTVAYMKKIAQGVGSRIFNPKPDVTYGELATLISNTVIAIENELKPVEQPIAKGSFETKGTCEIKDGKAVFDFELMSHFTESRELEFGSGQQFELIITDEKGEEVYKFSDGKFFTMALITKSIIPGESLKWQDEWDMTDKEGKKLTTGKYRAKISIMVISEENDEKIDQSQLIDVIDFELNAARIIKETADKLIHAISDKDSETISDYVHPVKGIRFTPYTNVSVEHDVVLSAGKMKNFFKDQDAYLWGYYDGKGDEIRLTPGKYYDKFIYSEDFVNAKDIGYNEVLSYGNMVENQFEVYDNPIVVEYYFPGFNSEYAGLDWKSLRLVFEQYENSWKLVGIIHNQWTI